LYPESTTGPGCDSRASNNFGFEVGGFILAVFFPIVMFFFGLPFEQDGLEPGRWIFEQFESALQSGN
jgi:hypothetical protein